MQPLILGSGDYFHLQPDWEGSMRADKQGMTWNTRTRSKGAGEPAWEEDMASLPAKFPIHETTCSVGAQIFLPLYSSTLNSWPNLLG